MWDWGEVVVVEMLVLILAMLILAGLLVGFDFALFCGGWVGLIRLKLDCGELRRAMWDWGEPSLTFESWGEFLTNCCCCCCCDCCDGNLVGGCGGGKVANNEVSFG